MKEAIFLCTELNLYFESSQLSLKGRSKNGLQANESGICA